VLRRQKTALEGSLRHTRTRSVGGAQGDWTPRSQVRKAQTGHHAAPHHRRSGETVMMLPPPRTGTLA